MKKYLYAITSAFIISLTFISCSKDNVENEPPKPPVNGAGGGILNENVYVLDKELVNNSIEKYEESNIRLKSFPYKLEKGDIINSGISDKVPDGFLKRITSISQEGDITILKVEDACIEDAVNNAKASVYQNATFDDLGELYDEFGNLVEYEIGESTLNEGTRSEFQLPEISFPINIPLTENISIRKTIKVSAAIEANLEIKDGKIDEFSYAISPKLTEKYDFEASFTSINFKKCIIRIPVDKFILSPGVNLVIKPNIAIFAVFEAGKLKLEVSMERVYTFKKGISYNSASGWSTIDETPENFDDPFKVSADFGFDDTQVFTGLSIVPAITIFKEDMFTVGIDAQLGFKFKFLTDLAPETLINPEEAKYGLYFSMSVAPYIFSRFLMRTLPEYETIIKEYTWSRDWEIKKFAAFPKFIDNAVIRNEGNASIKYILDTAPMFLFTEIGGMLTDKNGVIIETVVDPDIISCLTQSGKEYNYEFSGLNKEEDYQFTLYVKIFDLMYFIHYSNLKGKKDNPEEPEEPSLPLPPDMEYFVGTWEYKIPPTNNYPDNFLSNVRTLITFKRDKTFYYTIQTSNNFKWKGTWQLRNGEEIGGTDKFLELTYELIIRPDSWQIDNYVERIYPAPDLITDNHFSEYGGDERKKFDRVNRQHSYINVPYPEELHFNDGGRQLYFDASALGRAWSYTIIFDE